MNTRIKSKQNRYNGYFEVNEYVFEFDNPAYKNQRTDYSICEKSLAVAVLPYHRERNHFIFIKQFRPIVKLVHPNADDHELVEIPAGGCEPDSSFESNAIRECMEETGYQPRKLEKLNVFYPSPGILSEQCHLFFTEVDESMKKREHLGLEEEGEVISALNLSPKEAYAKLDEGFFEDAKTMLALFLVRARFDV